MFQQLVSRGKISLEGCNLSDMHLRDKLRKVTEAAKNSEQIPEHSKKIGLSIFFIFTFIGIFLIFAFAIALFFYGQQIAALISLLIAISLFYLTIKIRSADDIPKV